MLQDEIARSVGTQSAIKEELKTSTSSTILNKATGLKQINC